MSQIENIKDESPSRLKAMIEALRKHDVIHGLTPEKLKLVLEDLGPTFVKMGQIMSMRPDMLPQKYCDELKKLRSDVKPLTYDEIIQVIESEYNLPLDHIFTTIDKEQLGSASIAQVHGAILKNGKKVVLKVQRPGIYEIMAKDVSLLKRAVGFGESIGITPDNIDFRMLIDEMWAVAIQEMDFLMEANNMKEFCRLNDGIEYIDCVHPELSITTSRILVMEYVDGNQIDEIDKLTELGIDMNKIGMNLADNYAKQVLEDGFFQADPHPGNIRIRNGKIVWIDLGMVGKLSKADRDILKKLIQSMLNNDILELKNSILNLGVPKERINHTKLNADIDDMLVKYANADPGNLNVGELLQEIMDLSKTHNIGASPGMSLLARGIITLQGVLRICSPDVSFADILSTHISKRFIDNFDLKKELTSATKTIYYSSQKALDIPAHVSDLAKMTLKGQTKINLELLGSEEPADRLDEMVDKLILGIICAALIIGSSQIAAVDMNPQIFDIPILAIIGYTAAIAIGIFLLTNFYKHKKK